MSEAPIFYGKDGERNYYVKKCQKLLDELLEIIQLHDLKPSDLNVNKQEGDGIIKDIKKGLSH